MDLVSDMGIDIATPPDVPLFRAIWSLLDAIWGLFKGSWGVLVDYMILTGIFTLGPMLGSDPGSLDRPEGPWT